MKEERLCPPEFLYDAVNDHFRRTNEWLQAKGYSAGLLPSNNQFIAFVWMGRIPKSSSQEGKIFAKYGLKFHISLPEHNDEMYKKGWDIIVEILFRYQVISFKLIRSGYKMSDDIGQEGKDVTIYADAEPYRSLKEWKTILEEITNRLAEAKIDSGYRAPGTEEKPEKPIDGSNYITWRYCDEEAERKGKISPWPKEDPCLGIKIICRFAQTEPKKLDRQKTEKAATNVTKFM